MFGEGQITAEMLSLLVDFDRDDSVSDKIKHLRTAALQAICRRVRAYDAEGYTSEMCIKVLKTKAEFLLNAESKKEIEEIVKPPKPRDNGNKLVPGSPYDSPEEELIIWSQTSFLAPLNSKGFDRMMELMKECYGEEVYESIMGKTK